jgi:aryl-alcohol dehydrogenase-like predicted oxidoreductase
MKMEQRQLGKTGIQISPLVFGGNVFGWTIEEPMSFTLLDAFVDAGFNCIDTANVYSNWKPGNQGGESERIIGNWLKRSGKRDKVVIATKVGHNMGPLSIGLSKKYILREVEESLTRLQTDCIDLYQSHVDDKEVPLDETLSAYEKLIKQGKVRAIGASNYAGERLTHALKVGAEHKLPVYQTLQPLYNLYDRQPYESDLEPICVEHGLGVIPYFSLASGFLTGKYRSEADIAGRPRSARLAKYFNERGMRILKALDTVASQVNSTPAGVALAWMLARPSVTAPIASATNLDQLKELVAATRLKLDQSQVAFLNQESA